MFDTLVRTYVNLDRPLQEALRPYLSQPSGRIELPPILPPPLQAARDLLMQRVQRISPPLTFEQSLLALRAFESDPKKHPYADKSRGQGQVPNDGVLGARHGMTNVEVYEARVATRGKMREAALSGTACG